jgi:uncharacterized membrane protein YdjX (TVP38/TMEM64 family)
MEGWVRRAAGLVIVISLAAIIWAMPTKPLAEGLRHWSEGLGTGGVVFYLGAFVVFTIFSIPVWPLPFLAGALYGTLGGIAIASTSIAAAGTVTFWISRFLRRTWLRDYLEASPRMRALEKVVERSDWKAVAAIRFSHILTFGMQNYAFGLTQIGYRTFVVTTILATFPGTLLQVYLGHLGFSSVSAWRSEAAPEWQSWILRIGGLVVMAAAVLYIGHLWRTVYRNAVEQQLQKELEAQTATESDEGRWWTLVLLVLAMGFAGAAVWAVVQRDVLRGYVEQRLAASAAEISTHPGAKTTGRTSE